MNVGIIGTGAYGIALGSIFHENKCNITMWTKFVQEKEMLDQERCHKDKLPEVKIPNEIKFTTDIKEAICNQDLIVIAVPAAFVNDISKELAKYYVKGQPICIASKGIENKTCLFLSDVLKNYIPIDDLAVISGPSFAVDIVNKIPIGLSLATESVKAEHVIKKALQNNHLKIRTTDDIIGVEICGSIKNVIALAAGMLDGMGVPESTKAMFITESLHDIKELIDNLGGNKNTILSFAGFGDLLLTCTSTKSRNFCFGKLIGEHRSKDEVEAYKEQTTIEGLYTLKSIYQLVNNCNIDIPIIDLIYNIVFKGYNCNELLEFLITKE